MNDNYEPSSYFDFELNENQEQCFIQLLRFVNDEAGKVFILKGYAGTGKTTLLKGLVKYLSNNSVKFSLHATTGRAAKIATDVTKNKVTTVHSLIYRFQSLDDDLDEIKNRKEDYLQDDKGQIRLLFEARVIDADDQIIYIIDESSMISNTIDKGSSSAIFGSGMLLTDLFSFDKNGKYVFVGDPCQLPPISQKDSPALNSTFIQEKFKYKVDEFELTKVVRQKYDNGINKVANRLRKLFIQNPKVKWASLYVRGIDNIDIHNSHISMLLNYLKDIRNGRFMSSTLICQTNNQCFELNNWIRESLQKDISSLQVGDILMVTQNNYLCPLVNGDQVTIVELGEFEYRAGLKFRKVVVEEILSSSNYSILLLEDILFSKKTNLNEKQHKDLLIDFSIRMSNRGIKQSDDSFKIQMLEDPYLNALRAVFGYAITCHKSQGGEWDKVYLYLDNKIHGIPKPGIYQWWYTAVTRAKIELHLVDDWYLK